MERCFPACKYDTKVSPINSSESYWHTKKYVKIFEFTAAIRGYHYYKKIWKPESHQNLNCFHGKNNAFDRFAIMVCEIGKDETAVGHLPMEIPRVIKFFIDREGSIIAELTSDHHRRSLLIQGGIEIPCKVTSKIPGTVINLSIMEKHIQLVQKLYTEPKDEDILGSLLQVETTGTDDVAKVLRAVSEPKKRKNKSGVQTKDIRNFFERNSKQTTHHLHHLPTRIKHQKKKL